MSQELAHALVAASSPDPSVRGPAEEKLTLFENTNFPHYVQSLCVEMATADRPAQTRQLAGILLKNTITSRNEQTQKQLNARWLMSNNEFRAQIREAILKVLGSPSKPARDVACVVVAKIAAVEIPEGQWQDLIKVLIQSIDSAPNDELRESFYKCLGFVCEEIPDKMAEYSNPILDVISKGMKTEQPNMEVKLAATNTLYHCLDFCKANFANPEHRQFIMALIYSAAVCKSQPVRVASLTCLVQIAELYYEHLASHIVDIFRLTHQAIKEDERPVVLVAIEFWSTLSEAETDIGDEIKDAQELGRPPKRQLFSFVNKAVQHLAPALLDCLVKQPEDAEDDNWTEATAAGSCLALVSQCVKDNIVNLVLGFIQKNINDANWRNKEAAILAFGSILDGPTKEKLKPLVAQAFPLILDHCKDANVRVKDTAAWTVGRICDLLPQAIDDRVLQKLMNTLGEGLKDEPRVAANICWAIHNLAEAASPTDQTSPLSQYFAGLVGALLQAAERPDADESNLMSSSYEALNLLIESAAPDCVDSVEQLIGTLVDRLQKTAQPAQSEAHRQTQLRLQGLLVGTLATIILKLSAKKVAAKSQNLMQMFLGILQTPNVVLHEEVLMAVGAVAQKLGPDFERFFSAFKPFIIQALNEANSHEVCQVAVGVIGDVCRALENKIDPHCDDIVRVLLSNLGKPELERSVKPHVISCLGDVALAVGKNFDRYLPYVMMMFVQASQVTFENADYESIDYLNLLRESILETYTAIVHGLHEGNNTQQFDQYIPAVVDLIGLIVKDENRDSGVLNAACGVVGDILLCCGRRVADKFRVPQVEELVRLGSACRDEKVQKS